MPRPPLARAALPWLLLVACGGKGSVPLDETPATCDDAVWRCAGPIASRCEDNALVTATCAAEEVCLEELGCTPCGLTWDSAPADLPLLPALDGPWEAQRLRLTPLTLRSPDERPGAEVLLEAQSGRLQVYTAEGALLPLPATLPADALPLALYVGGIDVGDEALVATLTAPGDQACASPARLPFTIRRQVVPVGRTLALAPGFERVRALRADEPVQIALSPTVYPQLAGAAVTAHLLAHRDPAAWAADPSLGAGLVHRDLTLPADGSPLTLAEPLPAAPDTIGTAYDLVFDLDGDGILDPGEPAWGPGEAGGFFVLGDLTAAGPHAVETAEESGGVWLTERIYYPADLAALGPRPLVVISHGNGHEYTWYDYLGEHLASWGFVVMAHTNQTGPGIDTAAETTLSNTDWFLANLDTLAGGALAGLVDSHRIVWIGHSRGGEGVVYAAHRLATGDASPATYTLDDLALISSIAPTVFYNTDTSNPGDRPYHLLYGAADGDVNGAPDCPVCQSMRIPEVAQDARAITYIQGASHNDFNCCGFADGTGPDLIGRAAAQQIAKATYLALLAWRVDENPATADLLTRSATTFRSLGLDDDLVIASQWAQDPLVERLILDDHQTEPDTAKASGGAAIRAAVDGLTEGVLNDANFTFGWTDTDPMNGMTLAETSAEPSRGVVFGWTTEGSYALDLPAAQQDWRPYAFLSLRAAQGTRHPNTEALAGPLTFSVTLTDAHGASATLPTGPAGLLTPPYRRTGTGSGAGWANEWGTLRLRLDDFVGVDLSAITTLTLSFGGAAGSSPGRIGLDDIELVSE